MVKEKEIQILTQNTKTRKMRKEIDKIYKDWVNTDVSIKFTKPSLPVIVSVHGGPEGQERPGFNPL